MPAERRQLGRGSVGALESFDVIVVGGGPAGCVVAARLSEDSERTVALVEAGDDYGPRSAGRWPTELLDPSAIPESHDWSDGHESLPWARVVGGCSAHNACAVMRGSVADYDAWGDAGGSSWTWATLAPCLERARETIGARRRDDAEIGMWHAAVLDAAVEAGLPRLDDIDVDEVGVGVAPTNVVDGVRHNAAFAYLDPARGRPNLQVLGDTIVDRVVLDSAGRATGVVAGGTTIQGGCVVLAAGAYGSPAVLLRSGIGAADELRRHGIRLIHELPAVGAGLADHCRVGIGFELRPEAARAMRSEGGERTIVAQAIAKWASSRADPGTWDVHLLVIVPPDRASGRITTGLLAPRSRGRVRLAARDPERLPLVEPCFLSDDDGHDLAALTEGIDFARSLARMRTLSTLVTGEVDPGAEVDTVAHARATVTSYYHPTGTCALGTVVDANAAVLGLEGLHVADASIVPSPVRAGTHLTVLAVAERVAELMRGP
jgi:choline dehydrogenase